jgi:hypothetical protein
VPFWVCGVVFFGGGGVFFFGGGVFFFGGVFLEAKYFCVV